MSAFDEFGELLHQGWLCTKQLASKISNDGIDEMYYAARSAGAIGARSPAQVAEGFCYCIVLGVNGECARCVKLFT